MGGKRIGERITYGLRPYKKAKVTSKELMAMKRKLRHINPELKSITAKVSYTSVAAGGLTQYALTDAITQGTSSSQRVGESIRLMKIIFTGNLIGSQAADWIVYKCKENNAAGLGDFTSSVGSQLNPSVGTTLARSIYGGGDLNGNYQNNMYKVINFGSNGLKIDWIDGTVGARRNPIFYAHINWDTLPSDNINYTYTAYFYDV